MPFQVIFPWTRKMHVRVVWSPLGLAIHASLLHRHLFDLGLATIKGVARLAGPDIQIKQPGPECE